MPEAGNVENTVELRRRVQAARAYAGLSLDEFAKRVGIGRQTLVRIENGERPALKRMELREMAETANLPIEFFTEDLWLLANAPPEKPASQEELEDVRDDILALGLAVQAIADQLAESSDATREAMTATRAATQSLKARAVAAPSEPEAAGGTHDEEGATQESARSQREAKR